MSERPHPITRRQMMQAGVAAGSIAVVSWFRPRVASAANNVAAPAGRSFALLTPAEVAFVDAAVERLIPSDSIGPGAREAGATIYIDRQLAASFGRGDRWYMSGPWKDGTPEQGYQSKLPPARLYQVAIAAIDVHCRRTFGGKTFAALAPAEQDAVLHGLEQGDIALGSVSSKDFFEMLWQNTQEGFFADPLYGGNRDFVGWKTVGFPGPRYNYVEEIGRFGKPYALPTVGLQGRAPSG